MMIDMDSRVITLGTSPTGAVLNVATGGQTLIHLLEHLADASLSGHEQVDFFDQTGRRLVPSVNREVVGLRFEAAGDGDIGEAALQQRVRDVMVGKQEAATAHSSSSSVPSPELPLAAAWEEQLEVLSMLVDGSKDRKGFWHNLFVHGGNP
jgi:hypothetical protein